MADPRAVGKTCKRQRITIENENFYLIIGPNFVHPTVPDENKRESEKLRIIVETVCDEITLHMGGYDEEELEERRARITQRERDSVATKVYYDEKEDKLVSEEVSPEEFFSEEEKEGLKVKQLDPFAPITEPLLYKISSIYKKQTTVSDDDAANDPMTNIYKWVCSNCGVTNTSETSSIYTCHRCGHRRS